MPDWNLVPILSDAGILPATRITLRLALPVVQIRWLSRPLRPLVVGASLGTSRMLDMAVRLRQVYLRYIEHPGSRNLVSRQSGAV